MFHAQLVAVSLADRASLIGPLVPNLAVQVVDVVGLFLLDPQQLIHCRLPIGPTDSENRKLLAQVVAVHHTE